MKILFIGVGLIGVTLALLVFFISSSMSHKSLYVEGAVFAAIFGLLWAFLMWGAYWLWGNGYGWVTLIPAALLIAVVLFGAFGYYRVFILENSELAKASVSRIGDPADPERGQKLKIFLVEPSTTSSSDTSAERIRINAVIDSLSPDELRQHEIAKAILSSVRLSTYPYEGNGWDMLAAAKAFKKVIGRTGEDFSQAGFPLQYRARIFLRIAAVGQIAWVKEVTAEGAFYADYNFAGTPDQVDEYIVKTGANPSTYSKTLGSVAMHVFLMGFPQYPESEGWRLEYWEENSKEMLKVLQKHGLDFTAEEKLDPRLRKYL